MGGIVCAIPKHAILRFSEIPNRRRDLVEFDSQLRRCFEQPQIVQAVADSDMGEEAYEILELPDAEFTVEKRARLYEILQEATKYDG